MAILKSLLLWLHLAGLAQGVAAQYVASWRVRTVTAHILFFPGHVLLAVRPTTDLANSTDAIQKNSTLKEAGGSLPLAVHTTLDVGHQLISGTDNENIDDVTESAPSASFFEALSTRTDMGCTNFCFTCPKTDKGEISWKVQRSQGGTKVFAMGALALGTLATLGATGVVTLPIAGIVATVGLTTKAVVVGGALGGGYLVKNLLSGERACPNVKFHERNHANHFFFSGRRKNGAKETDYRLDEINLLEIMSQVIQETNGTNQSLFGDDYKRNKDMPTQDRLNSLLACNLLSMSTSKWGDKAMQTDRLVKMSRQFGNIKKAVIAECGKWLCVGEVEKVVELGHLSSVFKKCGSRRFR